MSYMEPAGDLSGSARDIARVLMSLKEEIEAIDYYNQRADTSGDEEVKSLMIHNRDEEIEHAVMCMELLRRRIPAFDENMRKFFFTSSPITEVEAAGGTAVGASLGIGKF